MGLAVDGTLEFASLRADPNAPQDGGVLLYVENGVLKAVDTPAPGPGGNSTGGVPGAVWYDTRRPPLVFLDTVATATQAPAIADLGIASFVVGDVVVRQADFEMFEYEQTGQSTKGLVDTGTKWSAGGGGATPIAVSTAARAFRNAAQGLVTGFSKVALDTVAFDPGGHFNLTNGRYVVPATGAYLVTGQVAPEVENNPQVLAVAIYKNGVVAAYGDELTLRGEVATDSEYLTVTDIIQCNAGDFLELWADNAEATTTPLDVGTSVRNYMSVVQVDQPIGGANAGAVTPTTGAKAYGTTTDFGTSISPSTWTKIHLDHIVNDPGNHTDVVTNHRYNVAATGWYSVMGDVMGTVATAAVQSVIAAIAKNGTIVAEGSSVPTSAAVNAVMAGTVSDLVFCTAGDYLELFSLAPGTSGGVALNTSNGAANNFLSVVQVDQPTPVATNTGARGSHSAAMNSIDSTFVKVPIDTATYDPGGHISTSQGRYNVTAAGLYHVDAIVLVNVPAPGSNLLVLTAIYKNGVLYSQGQFSPYTAIDGFVSSSNSDLVPCNPGDYLEVWVDVAGVHPISGATLSVVKVDQPLYANNPSTVTALPATPFDGQEIYFVADAANGVKWHLRYNAGSSSTHKWEYLGGPSMISRVDTDESFTSTTTGYVLAPTPDRLTIPLAGDYEYDMTTQHYQPASATNTTAGLSINGATPVAPDQMQATSGATALVMTKPGNLLNMVAGQTVAMEYNAQGGAVTHVRYRMLKIRPVRLG